MLMIRLTRVGKKKYPLYRIVIQEKSRDPWGKALEILGNYNPHTKEMNVKKERIEYWMSVGAKLSATVNNLLVSKEIIKGEKMKAAKLKKKNKKEEDHKEEKPAESKEKETKQEEKVEKEKTEEKKEEVKEEKKEEEKPAEEKKEDK